MLLSNILSKYLVCVCPHQLRVVPIGRSKLERLHLFVAEEADLVIPVSDGPLPVCRGQPDALLVDVEILTNSESED